MFTLRQYPTRRVHDVHPANAVLTPATPYPSSRVSVYAMLVGAFDSSREVARASRRPAPPDSHSF
ncbi:MULTISPECIES: hypothetical protein [Gulbenkiania]|uniref:Uncharacterized protein n=2 Tax=Gulbenkiania TaxID=397456 RepID=A0A0K6H5T6_9NEIS|nr:MULTISPECIES: hypothetical protein [Gulbenkiania]TCW29911.1 hypothetical protein EV669_10885 [Gulbenkiania mobilis]CUA86193.1 hypothetical protein Ga0061063_2604 [Gulbenkiania indica]